MIVFDSDLLVSALNGRREAIKLLQEFEAAGEELATTSVNVAEVLRGTGARSPQRMQAETLLRALTEVPFGPRAARRFADVMYMADRTGKPIPVVDAMVAAAVLEAGARLATRNKRHYARVPGLELI
jgi:tRNA(fMet)-specific endonuclease VapC